MTWLLWLFVLAVSIGLIVWGAEAFAENLGRASARLGVGAFALALLLAGAEPEELATVVASSLRDAPGIGFGDIVGANVAMTLVALGLGAALATLPFTKRVFMYALAALPVSILSAALIWDGRLSRLEGAVLVGMYVAYVGVIWLLERGPPVLGEVDELLEAEEELGGDRPGTQQGRVGLELLLVLAGLAATAIGATLLVEAVRQITDVEDTQTKLGLTLVGFATAFELVALVWSTTRRGNTDVALAGVMGSFGYNMTMSLGAGALVRPLAIADARVLHVPIAAMVALFALVLVFAAPAMRLGRVVGVGLLVSYPIFVAFVLL